ncbi:MAG: hypothetical protein QM780_03215 [Hyphomicrobium sp.]|uniref:hypothetical protein n=1 Tax=Hyphomicrobium sp. TaxID=82 RepID=UPI0039E3753F
MSEESENNLPNISPGPSDRAAAVLRAISSAVPLIGGGLAEVFTAIIPNQQAERFEMYLSTLARRLDELEASHKHLSEHQNAGLVEEGWRQARETTEIQRVRNIAYCVAHGITEDNRNQLHKSRLLALVAQLDAEEVSLLEALHTNDQSALNQLRPPPNYIGASEEVRERNAMWDAMWGKLKVLELISFRPHVKQISMPNGSRGERSEKVNIIELDTWGKERGIHTVTTLGRMVLESIGCAD